MGVRPRISKRPHLVGHEIENQQLDTQVYDAHAYVRSFDQDALPRDAVRTHMYEDAKRAYQPASKYRRHTCLRWKWAGLNSLTEELLTAQVAGDSRTVFAIHIECWVYGNREHYLKRNQLQHTVPDPYTEREAWKQHFQQLQAGRELASPHVWQNVSRGPQ